MDTETTKSITPIRTPDETRTTKRHIDYQWKVADTPTGSEWLEVAVRHDKDRKQYIASLGGFAIKGEFISFGLLSRVAFAVESAPRFTPKTFAAFAATSLANLETLIQELGPERRAIADPMLEMLRQSSII